jgi:uncharacterized protein YdhG (YjbR/CyaY superfamily)
MPAPKTVDDCLEATPVAERVLLMRLRQTIKAAAPKAVESLSYGIVGLKHRGQRLVYFGYWKTHAPCRGWATASTTRTPRSERRDKDHFR